MADLAQTADEVRHRMAKRPSPLCSRRHINSSSGGVFSGGLFIIDPYQLEIKIFKDEDLRGCALPGSVDAYDPEFSARRFRVP